LKCWRASNGRRAHQGDLHSGHRRDEGGAQRHLGLAEPDVAAHQSVHRLARAEIADHLGDRPVLVVRLLIGETVDEGGIAGVGLRNGARPKRSLGRGLDELARNLADSLLHLRLAPLPGLAAEPVERHALALASVAGEHVDILDRHVELVAARIAERDAVVRALLDRDLSQPFIAPDAVIGVERPGRRG
jgi:hypothetical protein